MVYFTLSVFVQRKTKFNEASASIKTEVCNIETSQTICDEVSELAYKVNIQHKTHQTQNKP